MLLYESTQYVAIKRMKMHHYRFESVYSIFTLTGSYRRPVMLIGPLASTISEGLLKVYTDSFQKCTQGM